MNALDPFRRRLRRVPRERRFLCQARLDPHLVQPGALIYGLTIAAAVLVWVLYERATGQPRSSTPQGVIYEVLVGLAFSGVTFLLYVTYSKVDVSIGSPAIRLSAILLAGVMGILILREPFTWRYLLGAILAIAGVLLIVFR